MWRAVFFALLLFAGCSTSGARPEDGSVDSSTGVDLAALPDPNDYLKVDLWFGGAKAAVSFTLDEGLKEPYEILMPAIDKRGWRATFFIYTEQPYQHDAWGLIRKAHDTGHEVANHTHTHPDLTTLSADEIDAELRRGIRELQKHLGQAIDLYSFSYPYERSSQLVWSQVSRYHRYARGGRGAATGVALNDAKKPNWAELAANANVQSVSIADWNAWIDAAVKAGAWLIEEHHGVCHGDVCGGWQPRTLGEFNTHFDHIESFGADVWVAPMRVVGNYIERRNSAFFVLQRWSPSQITVVVMDRFRDAAQFEIEGYDRAPLSCVLRVPAAWGWEQISVSRGSKSLAALSLGGGRFRITVVPSLTPLDIRPVN